MKHDQTEDRADESAVDDRQREQWERYRRFKEVTSAGPAKRKSTKKVDAESAG